MKRKQPTTGDAAPAKSISSYFSPQKTSAGPSAQPASTVLPPVAKCEECELAPSELRCIDCRVSFCSDCCFKLHSASRVMQKHVQEPVAPTRASCSDSTFTPASAAASGRAVSAVTPPASRASAAAPKRTDVRSSYFASAPGVASTPQDEPSHASDPTTQDNTPTPPPMRRTRKSPPLPAAKAPLPVAKAKTPRSRPSKAAAISVSSSDASASDSDAVDGSGSGDENEGDGDDDGEGSTKASAGKKKAAAPRRRAVATKKAAEGTEAAAAPRRRSSAKKGEGAGSVEYTQLEQQVMEIRAAHPDLVLLVEVGYKYRMFGKDAEIAQELLGFYPHVDHNFLTASLPSYRLNVHIRNLVEAGHKVGVVRQTEKAALKKAAKSAGPFTRELTEIYTKATLLSEDLSAGDEFSATASGRFILLLFESDGASPPSGGQQRPANNVTLSFVAFDPTSGDMVNI